MKFYYSESTDSHDTGWVEETVLGRSEPRQFYAAGSAVSIEFTGTLVAGETTSEKSLVKPLNLIRAWTYPVVRGGILLPPPVLILFLNSYQVQEVVLKSCQIDAKPPFDKDGVPLIQEVDFSLTRVGLKNGPSGVGRIAPTYEQVRRGGK